MNNAFFRTDFNYKIGFGHINRCLSLANIIKTIYNCHFVFTDTPQNLIVKNSEINEFVIHNFNAVDKKLNEITFLNKTTQSGDLIIFDSYLINIEYVSMLLKKGVKTISINDLPENCLPTNLIINYTLGIKKEQFNITNNTQLLLGLDYLLLRKEFLNYKPSKKINNLNKIFICLGTTDNLEIINKIISFVKIEDPKKSFSILVGNSEIKEKIISLKYSNIEVFYALTPKKVISLIEEASIAIVSSSTIALECIIVGVNLMTGYYVDNQKYLAQNIQANKMGVNLGNLYDLSLKNFKKSYLTLQSYNYKENQIKNFPKNQTTNYLNVFNKLKNE